MEYRHELKFPVSDMELEMIRYRIQPLMQTDVYQKEGKYTVRSLYFDDFYDSCLQENENGEDNRRKFRIRIYNGSDKVIKLEKKIKFRGMTKKADAEISKTDCLTYMSGKLPRLHAESSCLEKELYAEIRMNGMHPVCIVEYERTAFVEKRGNVRITFDRNISGSAHTEAFLDKELPVFPLLQEGQHVLEVKYDELLPEYISDMLNLGILQRTSFSKYYHARNFGNR